MNARMKSCLISALFVPLSAAYSINAAGQNPAANYPARPVVIISPNAPGAALDRDGRFWAQKLTESLGKPFVLDFKVGGGGVIGTNYVAKSPPDGHTLLIMTAAFTVAAGLKKDLPYDPIKDFAPVSMTLKRPAMLLVTPSLPVQTFPEYVAYARENPGKINFGTAGQGGIQHIVGAWIHGATNTKAAFIHYKGNGPQNIDLVAGRTHASISSIFVGLPLLKSGKLRAIAVVSSERSSLLPGVKTVSEDGIPGFDYSAWGGILAPAAVPPAIINRLSAEFGKFAKDPDNIKQFAADGTVLVGSSPAEFKQLIAAEVARWKKIGEDNDMKAEDD